MGYEVPRRRCGCMGERLCDRLYGRGTIFPALVGPDLTYNGRYGCLSSQGVLLLDPGANNAIGDFDGDATDELAVDMGTSGAWMYDGGAWTSAQRDEPEGMIAANVDGDADDELLLEFGYSGLWLSEQRGDGLAERRDTWRRWRRETWMPTAAMSWRSILGRRAFWLFDSGAWNQLSGANVEHHGVAELNGSGGAEIVGDFGAIGLWELSGGSWTQLSGVNVETWRRGTRMGREARTHRRFWPRRAVGVERRRWSSGAA